MSNRLFPTAALILTGGLALAAGPGPLDAWKDGVTVRPVLPGADRHVIHTYYVTSPESPDGTRVLAYTSADPAGHNGEVVAVDRATGAVTVLAKGVVTEDAHRVACQQWVSGGRRVVFHDLRGGEWVVASVDVATGVERVLAKGRQVGIGSPAGDLVPVVGLHWDAADFADVELVNAATGERTPVVTAAAVRRAYPGLVAELFGDAAVAAYYPILSPDGTRVIFKLAVGKGATSAAPGRAPGRGWCATTCGPRSSCGCRSGGGTRRGARTARACSTWARW